MQQTDMRRCRILSLFLVTTIQVICGLELLPAQSQQRSGVVAVPKSAGENKYYVGNRPPLLPNPLIELPVGSITPAGWIRRQLELMSQGFTGHLTELSKWCEIKGSAWVSHDGEGQNGWEELPYWLKGYIDLGHVLNDKRIID